MGQRTAQTIGEELLDYRNYLELEGRSIPWRWMIRLRAETGALSTGKAIGTGSANSLNGCSKLERRKPSNSW